MRRRKLVRTALAIVTAALLGAGPAPAMLEARAAVAPGGADALGKAVLKLLRESSVRGRVALERGFPTAVTGRWPVRGSTPLERARAYLRRHGDLWGLGRPGFALKVRRAPVGATEAVTFLPTFRGLPVYGAELTVAMEGDNVIAAVGRLLTAPAEDTVPALSERTAADLARRSLERPDLRVEGKTSLVVFDPSLFIPVRSDPRLAWRVTLAGRGGRQVFVDANTGAALWQQERSDDDAGFSDWELDLEHANGGEMEDTHCFNPTTIDDEAGDLDGVYPQYKGDPEIVLAWERARATYLFYHDTYGRHGLDGDDETLELYVHAGLDNASQHDDCGIQFGDGWVGGDVMTHEWTHGVTYLGHSGDPRSLSEHISDVMAEVFDDDGADWRHGEDRIGFPDQAVRDLANPIRDDMGEYQIPTVKSDWYRNAGILNKAAWLIGQGGSHNLFTVAGIGRPKLGHLFYAVGTVLHYSASFQGEATLARAFAESWASSGKHGFAAADLCSVRNGFAAVGLGDGDKDCDGVLDSGEGDDDGDGVADYLDNCNGVQSQQLSDTDGDGLGDVCDPDDDDDGVLDGADNCPKEPNEDQADTNRDGIGDECQDADGDDVFDADDNCPFDPNSGQEDSDSDGEGDACEVDSDGDGLDNAEDNCTFVPNKTQADADRDGIGDACDKCAAVADDGADSYTTGIPELGIPPQPFQPDSDGDGTPDACDRNPFGAGTRVVIGGDDRSYRPSSIFAVPDGVTRVEVAGPPGARILLPLSLGARACRDFPTARHFDLSVEGLPRGVTAVVIDEEGQRAGTVERSRTRATASATAPLELDLEGGRSYLLDIRISDATRSTQRFELAASRSPGCR
jgi:Zn-dependent metalloprotease